jgi:hypothetical protein
MEVKLTRGVAIAAASKEITQCIVDQRSPVARTALRVKDPWWRALVLTDLRRAAREPLDLKEPRDARQAELHDSPAATVGGHQATH